MENFVSRLILERAVLEVPFPLPPGKGVPSTGLLRCDEASGNPGSLGSDSCAAGRSGPGLTGCILRTKWGHTAETAPLICLSSPQIRQLGGTKALQQLDWTPRGEGRTCKSSPKIKKGPRTYRGEGPHRNIWKVQERATEKEPAIRSSHSLGWILFVHRLVTASGSKAELWRHRGHWGHRHSALQTILSS